MSQHGATRGYAASRGWTYKGNDGGNGQLWDTGQPGVAGKPDVTKGYLDTETWGWGMGQPGDTAQPKDTGQPGDTEQTRVQSTQGNQGTREQTTLR